MRKNKHCDVNKNSRITTKALNGRVKSFTDRRDPNTLFASAATDKSGYGETTVSIYSGHNDILLNGHEARTLYTLLQRHFAELGRTY